MADASAPATPAADTVFDSVESLWESVRALMADQFELLALEGRRAGASLITLFACALAIALLAVSAWLALIGALALLLVEFGLNAVAAMLGVTLLNLLAIAGLARTIRQCSSDLRFVTSVAALRAGSVSGASS